MHPSEHFTYAPAWVERAERRVTYRIAGEGVALGALASWAAIEAAVLPLLGAALFGALLAADLYYVPISRKMRASYSVEVAEHGLVVRIRGRAPMTFFWADLKVARRRRKDGVVDAISLSTGTAAGEITLEGLSDMDRLDESISRHLHNVP